MLELLVVAGLGLVVVVVFSSRGQHEKELLVSHQYVARLAFVPASVEAIQRVFCLSVAIWVAKYPFQKSIWYSFSCHPLYDPCRVVSKQESSP